MLYLGPDCQAQTPGEVHICVYTHVCQISIDLSYSVSCNFMNVNFKLYFACSNHCREIYFSLSSTNVTKVIHVLVFIHRLFL